MKQLVSVRNVDDNGRIVIPIEIRELLNINLNDKVEIFKDGSTIMIRKHEAVCIYCGHTKDIVVYRGMYVCHNCMVQLKSK